MAGGVPIHVGFTDARTLASEASPSEATYLGHGADIG